MGLEGLARRAGMRRAWVAAASALAMLALILVSTRASAHTIGLSAGEYTAKGDSLVVKLAFARGEVARLLPRLDDDRDGHVTALEVDTAKKDLEAKLLSQIHVTSGGAACSPALLGAALTEEDGLTVDGRFACRKGTTSFEVDVVLLASLARGHRHVARAVGASTHDEVLLEGHSSFSVAAAPAAAEHERGTAAAGPAEPSSRAWSFFEMGIEHILTGYDHLLFLFGLVLLRARLNELLVVVTAFTLAHSLTLAVAVLGHFTPSSRLVEPAIALSIAYVGVENFFVKDASKRWRITFPFGLVHGFGFAGALREIDLPRAQIPTALVSFNLGVEAGQLFAMALVLPIVMVVRQKDWFEPHGVRVLSGAVALAGGAWFVMRVVQGG